MAYLSTESFVGRAGLAEAVRNAPARQVIFAQFDSDAVAEQDADVILAHLAGQVSQHRMSVIQRYTKVGIGERLNDVALDFNFTFFLFRHRTPWDTNRSGKDSLNP